MAEHKRLIALPASDMVGAWHRIYEDGDQNTGRYVALVPDPAYAQLFRAAPDLLAAAEAALEVYGECRFDHHGLCQAHHLRRSNGEPECEVGLLRAAVAKAKGEAVSMNWTSVCADKERRQQEDEARVWKEMREAPMRELERQLAAEREARQKAEAACAELRDFAHAVEAWEADLLNDVNAWTTGLPKMTWALYDSWMVLRQRRNELLARYV